jgi:outer membrane lipoprotein-sorting protein
MILFLATLVLSSPNLTCIEDNDALAKGMLDAVAAVFKDTPAIAFETEIRMRVQTVEVARKANVLLKRPNLARLELSGAGQDALIILDGTTSWHYIKASKGFVKSNQLGMAKLEPYGVGPMGTLFFARGVGALGPYLSDAVVTKDKLGEEECSVVRWKVGTEETSLWIGGNRLRQFRTTRSIDVNVFEQTLIFGAIDLSPTVASDAFAFTPPEGAHPISGGDESGFLDVGASAPEFTAMYVDGSEMKLSDFKGKPVLLNFWFYGCATCREEFPWLQKLHSNLQRVAC